MTSEFLGEPLLFLISQPRSGSTLLQRLLANNQALLAPAEPWLMLHPIYGLRRHRREIKTNYNAQWAYTSVQEFLENYTGGSESYRRGLRAMAGVIYGEALQRSGRSRLLDKTPRYYLIWAELATLFPQARFIFLRRNPLAVLQSILTSWCHDDVTGLAEYRHDLLDGPPALVAGPAALGEKAVVVHYESLVTAPAATIKSICDFAGLTFAETMLTYDPAQAPRGQTGDQIAVDQHTRPVPDSLEQWRRLSASEQTGHLARHYLQALGPALVAGLGYDFDALQEALGPLALPSASIIPWSTALKSKTKWQRHDRLIVKRAQSRQQRGRRAGDWYFFRHHGWSWLRQQLQQLGKPAG